LDIGHRTLDIVPRAPIAAIATPPGEGGIAVIRASGKGVIELVGTIFRGKILAKQASHTAHFGKIERNGEVVDEVVATVFRGPKSFTGEDTVEISCHGGVLVTHSVLETVLSVGIRMAEPGEFTMRAFLNGKMELSQAEAVADMIHAKSRRALQAAQQQLDGALGEFVARFRQAIIDATAMLELELDFIEEDVEFADRSGLMKLLVDLDSQINGLLETYETGRLLRDGVRTVLVGRPNAGKSTLLNTITGKDRAIVSAIAGTTRDTIDADWTYGGIYFKLIDTAGLRITDDVIEAEGVKRSEKAIVEADVVMVLSDMTTDHGRTQAYEQLKQAHPEKPILHIGNKVDMASSDEDLSAYDVVISAASGQGVDKLKQLLLDKALGRHDADAGSLVITATRHRDALQKARNFVQSAIARLEDGSSNEFLSIDLRGALQELGHITGVSITNEDILDSIFSRFCIGK
jgi:tRNA modification GTPase